MNKTILFQFIIKDNRRNKLKASLTLYKSRDIALNKADEYNKKHFPNMIGNFYLTKEYAVKD